MSFFSCMGDLLLSYGLKLHRQTANVSLVGAVPQTRRFDVEGTADATGETVQDGWTTLVCAPEALRKEAQDWLRKLAPQATNDVRVLLCDSKFQDRELCGKRTFRHLGAFRKGQTNR